MVRLRGRTTLPSTTTSTLVNAIPAPRLTADDRRRSFSALALAGAEAVMETTNVGSPRASPRQDNALMHADGAGMLPLAAADGAAPRAERRARRVAQGQPPAPARPPLFHGFARDGLVGLGVGLGRGVRDGLVGFGLCFVAAALVKALLS